MTQHSIIDARNDAIAVDQTIPTAPTTKPRWHSAVAIIVTMLVIIAVREGFVWLCGLFGHEELGSLAGLFFLLVVLVCWKEWRGHLDQRLIDANAKMMKESGFALIPFIAGASMFTTLVGRDVLPFMLVIIVSTVVPLYGLAVLARRWL